MKILLNQVTVFRKGTAEKLSVLVEDGRIVSLSKEAPTLSDARVIELKNGSLFPGFVDVHVHSVSRVFRTKKPLPQGRGLRPMGDFRRVPHAQFEAGAGQLGTSASSVRGHCPGQRDSYLSLWRHYRGRAGGTLAALEEMVPPCGGFL